jgi:hypothetical protein
LQQDKRQKMDAEMNKKITDTIPEEFLSGSQDPFKEEVF